MAAITKLDMLHYLKVARKGYTGDNVALGKMFGAPTNVQVV